MFIFYLFAFTYRTSFHLTYEQIPRILFIPTVTEIKMTVHHWHDYFKNIKSKKLGSFSFDNREKEISRMYLIKHVNYILSND